MSFDSDPVARSESVVAINPADPSERLAASKLFPNHAKYEYWLATFSSEDGGSSWNSGGMPPRLSEWLNCGDPCLMFDDQFAYLVGNPMVSQTPDIWGVCVYRSSNGGRIWDDPLVIHTSHDDDKPACASDTSPASPYQNNLYITWDTSGNQVGFARSEDHGEHWLGIGANDTIESLPGSGGFSSIAVMPGGIVHVVSILPAYLNAPSHIVVNTSRDGGQTFDPPVTAVAGVMPLPNFKFRDIPFRVSTPPASCAVGGTGLLIAWTDVREGPLRTYYRVSRDNGSTWDGPDSGQPLYSLDAVADLREDCQPQLAALPEGKIACALYRYAPQSERDPPLINVVTYVADNLQSGFDETFVTLAAWDPTLGLVHDNDGNGFVGDYFGLAGAPTEFQVLWTDTRTGRQELFADRVVLTADLIDLQAAARLRILFGVIEGAGGIAITPSGGVIHVPPRTPAMQALEVAERESRVSEER